MAVINQIDEETRTASGLFADLPAVLDAPWRVGDRYIATDTSQLFILLRGPTPLLRQWLPVYLIGQSTPIALPSSDHSSTPGATIINKPSGRVAVPGGGTVKSVVVTNSLVTTASHVFAQLTFADATCTEVLNVIPANGSFTINCDANATLATACDFVVFTAGG
jgi:hypothetical protein